MGIFSRGQPARRIFLGDQPIARVYLGAQLVWYDPDAGTVGVAPARMSAVMHAPRVVPGFGAAVATMAIQMRSPVVSSHATVPAPRASANVTMRAPDTPTVAAAAAAAFSLQMHPPTYRDAEVISASAIRITAVMPVPVVGVAVVAPTMLIESAAHAPAISATSSAHVPTMHVDIVARAPAHEIATAAPPMSAAVEMHAPAVFATAIIAVPPATVSLAIPIPVGGVAVAPPAMAVSATANPPTAVAASSSAGVPAIQVSASSPAPGVRASSAVAAPAASASFAVLPPTIQTAANYSDAFPVDGPMSSNWVTLPNEYAPVVASQAARAGSTGPNGAGSVYGARWKDPVFTDTQEVTFNVVTPAQGAALGIGGGGILRCNSAGDRAEALITNSSVHVFTRIGGTAANRASANLSVPTGTAVRFTAVGNVYRIYLNGSGTPAVTWTDSGGLIGIGASNRYVGIVTVGQKSGDGTVVQYGYAIDNWIGRDL